MADKKMGRPKAEDPRQKKIQVRFTIEEYDRLLRYATERNLTITQLVRDSVKPIIDEH